MISQCKSSDPKQTWVKEERVGLMAKKKKRKHREVSTRLPAKVWRRIDYVTIMGNIQPILNNKAAVADEKYGDHTVYEALHLEAMHYIAHELQLLRRELKKHRKGE